VNKGRITVIVLFAMLGILLLLFFIFNNADGRRYQWRENYKVESDQPYGLSFIKALLESYRPNSTFTFNKKKTLQVLLDSTKITSDTDYIFIGQSIYLDERDLEVLLNFIYTGNDAFISSLELPETLINKLYTPECNKDITLKTNEVYTVSLNFYHETLYKEHGYNYTYKFGNENASYSWSSLNHEIFCEATKSITPLGYQNPNRVNFIQIPYGKGNVYFHCNPLVFTNYFLTQQDKIDYAAGVFSHLKGNHIIWDEYSKIPFYKNNKASDSPLYYILQQPSLKYAWWLLILTVLLYVFFAAKRTQRVIPVLEAKTNTSLEFVNLIATLHYQNSNHLDMARKKMKYFRYFIRSKYGIHAVTFGESHIRRLSGKSKISIADVQVIFDQYNLIERHANYNIEPNRLVNFYYSIENFYKHCK
jgi:hypothetical protein